jgi:triacylglycerol lipase
MRASQGDRAILPRAIAEGAASRDNHPVTRWILIGALAAAACNGEIAAGADASSPPDASPSRPDASSTDAGRPSSDASSGDASFDEDPVVFVHGYGGKGSDFDTMVGRFKQAGYPADQLFAIDFTDSTGSNLKSADELKAFVATVLAKTGAPKVDLVAHSMGALSARLYLKNTANVPVRDVVTVAGANHGNDLGWLGFGDGAKEMQPAFACQGQSLNDVQFQLNGCLTDSGRSVDADETPGDGVAYLAIRTTTDEVISPSESECLRQAKKKDCSDPVNTSVSFVTHNGMLKDQDVFDKTIAHLRARNQSHP